MEDTNPPITLASLVLHLSSSTPGSTKLSLALTTGRQILESQYPMAGRQTSKATTPVTTPWNPMCHSSTNTMGKRTVNIKRNQIPILCQVSSTVVICRLPSSTLPRFRIRTPGQRDVLRGQDFVDHHDS